MCWGLGLGSREMAAGKWYAGELSRWRGWRGGRGGVVRRGAGEVLGFDEDATDLRASSGHTAARCFRVRS